MDTQLFMECEEEELEPWQLVDDCVEEDDDNYMDYPKPVEDSPGSSPLTESPPPAPPPATFPAPTIPVSVQAPVRSFPMALTKAPVTMTTATIKAPPLTIKTTPTTTQAPPIILSQFPQGTFLVTQGFPMMNSGTPLVFNLPPGSTVLPHGSKVLKPGEILKPGQTVFKPGQPLTLIQSPSMGQVVRPVTPVRGPAPTPGLMHLTIRAKEPITGQRVAPVCSPAHPAGSSNGVARSITIVAPSSSAAVSFNQPRPVSMTTTTQAVVPPFAVDHAYTGPALSGPAPSVPALSGPVPSVPAPSVPAPSCPSPSDRVVMSVEEFYYGTSDGDEKLRDGHKYTAMLVQFPCSLCEHQANNNLRLMQHMLTHWKPVNRADDYKSCKFCYRHFSNSISLKEHLDKVHGPAPSNCVCRICEWAFEDEPTFLNHMKSNHKPGEMPYYCQICFFRSSFYSDVIQHFFTFHRETRFLLCVFCLKVLKNSELYQQHVLRHQLEASHCNRCRLQFIFLREKIGHKTEHHRSYRRPVQLEGLPPGSKVTIRTFGRRKMSEPPRPPLPGPAPSPTSSAPTPSGPTPTQSTPTFTLAGLSPTVSGSTFTLAGPSPTLSGPTFTLAGPSPTLSGPTFTITGTAPLLTGSTFALISPAHSRTKPAHSDMIQPINIKTDLQPRLLQRQQLPLLASTVAACRWRCVECGDQVSKLSSHYSSHVRCLLCSYNSCCSKAYAAHMLHSHNFPRSKEPPPLRRAGAPPSRFSLFCSLCHFVPVSGDHMAKHLVTNPSHGTAIATARALSDRDLDASLLGRCDWPVRSALPKVSACDWSMPGKVGVAPFKLGGGPDATLPRSGDAADFFQRLFPDDLIAHIAKETNAHVNTLRYLGDGNMLSDWTVLSMGELKAFLGLVILMGLQTFPDLAQYWSNAHYDHSSLFNQVMSHLRFTQILQSVRPGNPSPAPSGPDHAPPSRRPAPLSRRPTFKKDPLQMFRRMLQLQGQAMSSSYRPRCCLSLDRTLLPGLTSQDQIQGGTQDQDQSPERPRSQGPSAQVWLLCDSRSGFCHRLQVQTDPSPLVSPLLVLDLLSGLEQRHHQVFLSNTVCTEQLLIELHHRGIYGSASFPRSHAHFPTDLWADRVLDHPGDYVQKQRGSVLATRWMDVKEMGFLSTNATPGGVDQVWRRSLTKPGTLDPVQRPEAVRLLQENMRGADICKQLLACNALGGVASVHPWKNLLWLLVNISVVNAFLVFRETRKDCPPTWVLRGLFTQESFRRRLGTQLAKCFTRLVPPPPLQGSLPQGSLPPGTLPQGSLLPRALPQGSHHMVKLSKISKRCKKCLTLNRRRESLYGCSVCRVNLCQTHNCFWEYHNLEPRHTLSSRSGFTVDPHTGTISLNAPLKEEVDLNAPLEEESEEEEAQHIPEGVGLQASSPLSVSSSDTLDAPALSEQVFSAILPQLFSERQLQILLCALCEGVSRASQLFHTEEEVLRRWLKEAQEEVQRIEEEPEEAPKCADVSCRMVAFVLSEREQQVALSSSALRAKVSSLQRKALLSVRFSYEWAVFFMLLHRLQYQGVATAVTQQLPLVLARRCCAFRSFSSALIARHALPPVAVATMDELCVYGDFSIDHSRAQDLLRLQSAPTGSAPLMTVFLCALSDGTLLPALIVCDGHQQQRALPDCVLLQNADVSADVLELWRRRVWAEHVRDMQLQKSLLLLDAHRLHDSNAFVAAAADTHTIPAIVPKGLSHRLHPLELCVTPVLKRWLQERWRSHVSKDTNSADVSADLSKDTNSADVSADVSKDTSSADVSTDVSKDTSSANVSADVSKGTSSADVSKDTSSANVSADVSKGTSSADVSKDTSSVNVSADVSKGTSSADVSKDTSSADVSADVSKDTSSADVSKDTSSANVSADVSKDTSSADVSKDTSSANVSADVSADGVSHKPLDRHSIVRSLVEWTVEALEHISRLPDIIEESFQLAGVLEARQEALQEARLQEIQDALMKRLSVKITGKKLVREEDPDFWDVKKEVKRSFENSRAPEIIHQTGGEEKEVKHVTEEAQQLELNREDKTNSTKSKRRLSAETDVLQEEVQEEVQEGTQGDKMYSQMELKEQDNMKMETEKAQIVDKAPERGETRVMEERVEGHKMDACIEAAAVVTELEEVLMEDKEKAEERVQEDGAGFRLAHEIMESEEEVQQQEAQQARLETRILMGADLGDEWQVQSLDNDAMDES